MVIHTVYNMVIWSYILYITLYVLLESYQSPKPFSVLTYLANKSDFNLNLCLYKESESEREREESKCGLLKHLQFCKTDLATKGCSRTVPPQLLNLNDWQFRCAFTSGDRSIAPVYREPRFN